jgi:hypothetical protein
LGCSLDFLSAQWQKKGEKIDHLISLRRFAQRRQMGTKFVLKQCVDHLYSHCSKKIETKVEDYLSSLRPLAQRRQMGAKFQ